MGKLSQIVMAVLLAAVVAGCKSTAANRVGSRRLEPAGSETAPPTSFIPSAPQGPVADPTEPMHSGSRY